MSNLFSLLTLLLFSTSTFAQDMYLEYKTSGTMAATNKVYTSSTSGMRMEMEMNMPQIGKMLTIVMMPKGKNSMYILNEKNKTYTESPLNGEQMGKDLDYSIQVVGKEKVAGYNCVHLKVTTNKNQITDMWTTKDIAGYEAMEVLTKGIDMFGSKDVFAQLKSKGADGIMVKTVLNMGGSSMVNELVKVEKRSNPASLFALPASYSKVSTPKY